MSILKRTLVANRGEIAIRVIKALKEMGIETVAVYSNADKDAMHVKIADEKVCIGEGSPSDSYLNIYKIMSAAMCKKVDSIHPGIGFLAENKEFPQICQHYGITYLGPDSDIVGLMGNKNSAKQVASECGIPVIKGSIKPVETIEECYKEVKEIGLPLLLKATHGGGGKGIRLITEVEQVDSYYRLCKREAESSFSNGELLIEQFLEGTRHIEVQIIGDKFGNVVHLGDRECTIQRNNQKFIEEARSCNISEEVREQIYIDAVKLASYIKYTGPGTVEFLVLPNGKYFFLEMNTRLQVEHTITELITEIDIVKEQIKVFSGEKLNFTQEQIKFRKYAIECRVLAENVFQSFMPSYGKLTKLTLPGGLGIRIDSGYSCNDVVSPYYDSLILKISCCASDKKNTLSKMQVCLEELKIEGVATNIEFLQFILNDPQFLIGDYDEKYVNKKIVEYVEFTKRV